jgi:Arc/MetJ-type ribon-helix-helix transcriptional regulator
MTIHLSPEQEHAIQEAIESGLFRSVHEFIDAAIANIPRANVLGESSRQEAVQHMVEFGEKYRLNLGEPVTRKFMHEGHRY